MESSLYCTGYSARLADKIENEQKQRFAVDCNADTLGHICGLLEAWGDLAHTFGWNATFKSLTPSQQYRLRQLRGCLDFPFMVSVLTTEYNTNEKRLLQLLADLG